MTAQESKLSNAYESTITTALTADASGTSISVDTAPTDSTNTAISGAVVMYLVIDPDSDSSREYVKVTNISGTTLTVVRNIDTGAGGLRTHAAGAKIRQTAQAQHFDDIHDRVDKVINTDGSSLNTDLFLDEDDMVSDSATKGVTQQSVKAYVDSQVASKDDLSELTGTTDDVTEGSTNLYFTTERVDDQVAALITAGANVTVTYDDTAGTLTIAATEDDLSNNDTDDLAEGASNLYFTTERVDDQVATLLTAGSNITLTYDDVAGTLTIAGEVEDDLSNNTTDDLAEGSTNLYYTTARFDTAFSGKSTTDLTEGTNLYYTTARFDTAFSGKDTDDLTEGATNLYFTNERVDDQVASLLTAGTNITLTYDDGAGTLTIDGTDTDTVLTQEQVEDIVGSLITAGTNVTVNYDDTAGTLEISSTDTQLTQEQVEDYVGGLIAAGSGISVTYDDAAGTLTIANTASTSTEEVQDIVGDMLVTNGTHTGISFTYDDAGDGAIDATVSVSSDEILDADNDTKIQVEETADEDIIRFDTAGVERATLQGALDLTDDGGAFIHSQTQAGTYTIASGKGTLFAGPITITGTVTNAGTMVVI